MEEVDLGSLLVADEAPAPPPVPEAGVVVTNGALGLLLCLPVYEGPSAGHALLRGLLRVAQLGDACGRWCAENKKGRMWWSGPAPQSEQELKAQLAALAPQAPAEVREHLAAVFGRLRRATVETKDGSDCTKAEAAVAATYQSASYQVGILAGAYVAIALPTYEWRGGIPDDALSVQPYLSIYEGPSAGHALLLRGLLRVAEISDACGRWCAENMETSCKWSGCQPALRAELGALYMRLAELAVAAPADVQRHFALTTVRLAQVAKAFQSTDRRGRLVDGCARAGFAKQMNAEMQLSFLHGPQAKGAAHACGAAECARLGEEMDAAWLAFPEAGRAALAGIPWENDPDPAEIGVWTQEAGDDDQWGKPILRPALRQSVPSGYVATDFWANDDPHGTKYVEEHLLPAARRVLPQLEAAVRRVAEAVGLDPDKAVRIPPLKTALRMDEKAGEGDSGSAGAPDHLLHEYPRQASNVDVARVMLVLPSPAHVVRAVALLKTQNEVVRLKNRFARPSGGLRDMLLNVRIDGVFCEVQVGIETLVAVRRKMHKFYGVVRSIGFKPLVAMAKPLRFAA